MTSQSPSQPIDPINETARLLEEYRELERQTAAKLLELEAAFRKIDMPLPLFDRLEGGR